MNKILAAAMSGKTLCIAIVFWLGLASTSWSQSIQVDTTGPSAVNPSDTTLMFSARTTAPANYVLRRWIYVNNVNWYYNQTVYQNLQGNTLLSEKPVLINWPQQTGTILRFELAYVLAGTVVNAASWTVIVGGATTAPVAPTSLTATPGPRTVSLSWPLAPGAESYNVKRYSLVDGGYIPIGNTTKPYFTDFGGSVGLQAGTSYSYVVSSLNVQGISANSSPVAATPTAAPTQFNALFVVGNLTLSPADAAISSRLSGLGYTVLPRLLAASNITDAKTTSLVVFSPTVTGAVPQGYAAIAQPLLNCSPATYSGFLLDGAAYGTTPSQTNIFISDGSHPMAAGLAGQTTHAVASSPATFGWSNVPTENGTYPGAPFVIATMPGQPSNATIYGVDYNWTTAPVTPAPTFVRRRIAFPLLSTATATSLNTTGWSLFDAAVRFSAGVTMSSLTVNVQRTASSVTITWNPSPGELAYNVYRSLTPPTPGNLGTLIGSNVTLASFVDTSPSAAESFYSVVPFTASGMGASNLAVLSAAAATSTTVEILGPGYIRRRPPAPITTEYCSGSYTALVKYWSAVGNSQLGFDARNYDTQYPGFWHDSGAQVGTLAQVALWEYSFNSLATIGDEKIGTTYLPKGASFPNPTYGHEYFVVKSRTKVTLNVWIKYPGDANGRTARTVLDNGVERNFYDTNQDGTLTTGAITARGIMATKMKNLLRQYWGQALIDFYVESDLTPPGHVNMQLTGFAGNGVFNNGGAVISDHFEKLQSDKKHYSPNSINIWLMKQLLSGDTGVAISGGTVAILSDGTASDNHLALLVSHEIGHCLGLDDSEKLVQITGVLNNAVNHDGSDAAARTRLLMLHTGGSLAPAGGWLTAVELENARLTVTKQNPKYPAFRELEPN